MIYIKVYVLSESYFMLSLSKRAWKNVNEKYSGMKKEVQSVGVII